MYSLRRLLTAPKGPFHDSSAYFKGKTKYDAPAVKALETRLLSYFSASRRYLNISIPALQVKSAADASAILDPMLFPSLDHPPPPSDPKKEIRNDEENEMSPMTEETSVYCTTNDLQNAVRYRPECKDMLRYRLLSSRFTNLIDKGFKERGSGEYGFKVIQREIEEIWKNARAAYRSLVELKKSLFSRANQKEMDFPRSPFSSSRWRPEGLPDRVVFIILHSGCQQAFPVGEPMRTIYERIRQLAHETSCAGRGKILQIVPVRIGLQDCERNGIPKYNPKDPEKDEKKDQNGSFRYDQAEDSFGPPSSSSSDSALHFPYGGLYTLHGVLQRLRALPSIKISAKAPKTKSIKRIKLGKGLNRSGRTLKRRVLILSDAWLQPRLAAAIHGAAIDPEKDWLERRDCANLVENSRRKAIKGKRLKPRSRQMINGSNDEHVVNVFPAVMSEGLSEKEIDAFARYALVHYILS